VAPANTSALERMVSAMLPSGLRKEEGPKA
jgi:hypothetical protein